MASSLSTLPEFSADPPQSPVESNLVTTPIYQAKEGGLFPILKLQYISYKNANCDEKEIPMAVIDE